MLMYRRPSRQSGHGGAAGATERVKDDLGFPREGFDERHEGARRLFRRMVEIARVLPAEHVIDGALGARVALGQEVRRLVPVLQIPHAPIRPIELHENETPYGPEADGAPRGQEDVRLVQP